MLAVTGATGNTGSVIAEKLLAQGEKVRVIGRDAGRLARLSEEIPSCAGGCFHDAPPI